MQAVPSVLFGGVQFTSGEVLLTALVFVIIVLLVRRK